MEKEVVIKVKEEVLDFCNKLLERRDRDLYTEENPYTFTANFESGIEADIKVVNANPPYIDAVLFFNGCEIQYLEPYFETLEGTYIFEDEGNIYKVIVR